MIDKIPNFIEIGKRLIKDAQTIAEVEMINFVLGNFDKQGFVDGSINNWQGRKDGADSGRAILMKTAALRDATKITQSSSKRVVLSNDSKYAKLHNEGGVVHVVITKKMRGYFWAMYKQTRLGKWKAMALNKNQSITFTMPKRQFMGPSATFNKTLDTAIAKAIVNRFKNS